MKTVVLLLLSTMLFCSCAHEDSHSKNNRTKTPFEIEVEFDPVQWKTKEGTSYPNRKRMLHAVLYSDSLRTLNHKELINALGTPDRNENKHLYYLIEKKNIGIFTLTERTLVVKINDMDRVEWIKLHE